MKAHVSLFRSHKSQFGILEKSVLAIFTTALLFWAAPASVHAADDSASAKNSAATAPAPAPNIDEGYTAKIKQFTTDPQFSTELVDHLPASATVPTPEKVLGYIAGAENHLTYTKELYRGLVWLLLHIINTDKSACFF